MRDGIYRVWFKGPDGTSAGAMAFRGGEILGSDAAFAVVGRYSVKFGQLQGTALFTRFRERQAADGLPDLDSFHLILSGKPQDDIATLRGTVTELPGFYVACELARVSDP